MTSPRIEAIALVGSKNQRLFLSSRSQYQSRPTSTQQHGDESLRLEYAAHCCLDVVEERMHPKSSTDGAIPAYLGLVSVLEDLAIYAMVTSTKLKILLILRPGEARIKDIDCLTILRAIHTSYLSYASNPFLALPNQSIVTPSNQIHSKQFEQRIQAIGGW